MSLSVQKEKRARKQRRGADRRRARQGEKQTEQISTSGHELLSSKDPEKQNKIQLAQRGGQMGRGSSLSSRHCDMVSL